MWKPYSSVLPWSQYNTTNVHLIVKLVLGQSQSLLLAWLWSSRLCQCPTPAAPKMLFVRLGAFLLPRRASLLLLQSSSYSPGVQLHCKILYTSHSLSPSIAPSYTFLPANNVHPALRKVIIKYSCLRNKDFIHRSAHSYHQVRSSTNPLYSFCLVQYNLEKTQNMS